LRVSRARIALTSLCVRVFPGRWPREGRHELPRRGCREVVHRRSDRGVGSLLRLALREGRAVAVGERRELVVEPLRVLGRQPREQRHRNHATGLRGHLGHELRALLEHGHARVGELLGRLRVEPPGVVDRRRGLPR
jgi:hypothetical protein